MVSRCIYGHPLIVQSIVKPPIRFFRKCQEKVHQYLSPREAYLSKTQEVEALHVSIPAAVAFMG